VSADPARNRWLVLVLVRIVAACGAVLGLVLLARAVTWPPKLLGVAIVLSALYVMAVVPRALAHRWRTPPRL
jgi:predicted membrane-bound spermidine synthase